MGWTVRTRAWVRGLAGWFDAGKVAERLILGNEMKAVIGNCRAPSQLKETKGLWFGLKQ